MKKVIELLVLFRDHNLLYFVLPILVEWYGVIAPYHHLFCCNVLAHDLLGGSICHGNPCHRFYNLQVFLLEDVFLQDLRNPPKFAYSAQTNKDSPRQTTQSGPDSQTARPQARNSASGCNAAPSRCRSTDSEV